MRTSVPPAASRSTTGSTRRTSSSSGTGSEPGRVDSPPMSRIPAPSLASRRPCATAASASRNSPPSENESGVTLTMPMITGARTCRAHIVVKPRVTRAATASSFDTVVSDSSMTVRARSISSSLTVSGGAIRRQLADPAL